MDIHRANGKDHQAPLLNGERNSNDIELERLDDLDYADDDDLSIPEAFLTSPNSGTVRVKKTLSAYLAITAALVTTVVGFTINTEATAYFEDVLGWKKPFMTMYITHSSLCLPWLCHLAYLRFKQRTTPHMPWVKEYNNQIRAAVSMVDAYASSGPMYMIKCKGQVGGPLDFLATTMAIVTVVLTISGCSWFLSLGLTTPGDLTAIYNCSTFFAAVFSVPILKEKLGWISITAVAMSIIGTFVIAYGDTTAKHEDSAIGTSRLIGNLIACIGAVAFGLYEVLFKKWASSSQPLRPSESLPLTFAASALTGIYTFATVWILLVVLHLTGKETFSIPSAQVVLWITISVLSGSLSINLLVVLVVWTDAVFGSMVNVLSVVAVAIADWLVFGLKPSIATYIGGIVIIIAFAMLAKDTLGRPKH